MNRVLEHNIVTKAIRIEFRGEISDSPASFLSFAAEHLQPWYGACIDTCSRHPAHSLGKFFCFATVSA